MGSKGMVEEKTPLLRVQALKKYFPIVKGFFNRVVGQIRAVDEVSFSLHEGECLALVGESGSGKTTVGRSILRAIQPTGGSVWIKIDDVDVDISKASEAELKVMRRHMQLIFQDPYSSLNPRMTVLDIVGEPLWVNKV
jgi:peptide/nickel transport system ATP-binding protein